MRNTLITLCFLLLFESNFVVAQRNAMPKAPDYSLETSWFSKPGRKDNAHMVAGYKGENYINDDTLKADVFFVYPTIYSKKYAGHYRWNADTKLEKLNRKIDKTTIKYQSTAFNFAGRMYIPKYRQANIKAYYTSDGLAAKAAFDTAYADVRRAFIYYMEHYNNGRPIIIASHSQGTNHTERLLAEFFDGKPLQKQLVAAYLVGMPINTNRYQTIKPCSTATDTECFCSWGTYRENYYPKTYIFRGYADAVATNPISWKNNDDVKISPSENRGTLIWKFDRLYMNVCGAQSHIGLLWAKKPRFPGSGLITIKNYHLGDINLYYQNVRENAILRVSSYLKAKP